LAAGLAFTNSIGDVHRYLGLTVVGDGEGHDERLRSGRSRAPSVTACPNSDR
jgi:hypothetical protein